MPKIEIEIPPSDFEVLSEIAKKVGCSVDALVQREVDDALTNAVAWVERAHL